MCIRRAFVLQHHEGMTKSEDNSPITVGLQPEHTPSAVAELTSDVDGAARLLRLAQLADELGSSRIADEARNLAGRISEGLFYVACIGQFKRGKSTLINALIGRERLPVGVIPVTSAVTLVRQGAAHARVRFVSGQWQDIDPDDIGQFVCESANPENVKGVAIVELSTPS